MKPSEGPDREGALGLVGDRWAVGVLLALDEREGSRFSDLASLPGLSRRVLTERLRLLQDRALVRAERYQVRPVRNRYVLTERGLQLRRLLEAAAHVAAGGMLRADPLDDAPGPDESPATSVHGAQESAAHPADALLAADVDAARRIHAETVAPLAAYDDQYRTSLLETLVTWFACDTSVSVTAARLYTHRHTIRYRLDRVRELTGHDTATSVGREQLMLGLRARRVLRDSGYLAEAR